MLTRRERAVLALIGSGRSAVEIAEALGISPRTVANHKRRLYAKLGVGCQTEAVSRAISLGVFDDPPAPVGDAPREPASHDRSRPCIATVYARGSPDLYEAAHALVECGLAIVVTQVELTPREHDVLSSIADGRTIRQTARMLGIAAKTVENTRARLFRKLGARNRSQTLTIAYRLGLLPPGPAGPCAGRP